MDGDRAEHLKAQHGCRICEHDSESDCTVLSAAGHHAGRIAGGRHSDVLHQSAQTRIRQYRHPLPRDHPQGAQIRC